MSNFWNNVSGRFTRPSNKSNNQQKSNGTSTPSPTSAQQSPMSLHAPQMPPMPHSPMLSPSAMSETGSQSDASNQSMANRKPPFFFREEYSGLIVKGNFMTLAAKPKLVEQGEWLAHQVVEQYRLLDGMIQIISTLDDRTGRPLCNPETCPSMSAAGHTYTWLDNNRRPIKIPACQYINLVQKWIMGKISDPALFPTDGTFQASSSYASGGLNTPGANTPIPAGPTSIDAPLSQLAGDDWLGKVSGFPRNFESDVKSIYRQMMRCYAHIYHGHWLDPFWNIGAYKDLNTCFIHFINVGTLFGLINEKEMAPMQPLIELWVTKGLLPASQASAAQAPSAPCGTAAPSTAA